MKVLDRSTELWLDAYMTNTATTTAHLYAKHIGLGVLLKDDLDALHSDEGLSSEGLVVWHRIDDDMVVVWEGNERDFDMQHLIEVPVVR